MTIADAHPVALDEQPVITADRLVRFEVESRRAFARGLYERRFTPVARTRHPNAALLNHLRADR